MKSAAITFLQIIPKGAFCALCVLIFGPAISRCAEAEVIPSSPQECDYYFSKAQYDTYGAGFGFQRRFIDDSQNIYKVYPSSVLSIQPKCIFFQCKLGDICSADLPMGSFKRQFVILSDENLSVNEWIEKDSSIIDSRIITYPRRR